MKNKLFARTIMIAGVALLFLFSNTASAYWVWTPGTKKFINPKNAVKDTPKEQFEWAMTFYNAKDYQRGIAEFEKLVKQYEYSEYASKAQYYVGLSYESMNKPYIAYQNYQKAIDNFPHIENMDEIVAREFNIANMFVTKESPKVLGTDIMTSLDRAIEIYKKVVDNAPYGRLADEAQFRMAQAMKKAERYDEAIQSFQKLLDDYPTSTFVDKAKFEVADCANKASLKPAYDVEPTAKAIKAFEDFSHENRDVTLSREADKTIQRLRDKAAQKSLLTAQFYEKIGRYQAAVIYYKDVVTAYPDSSFVDLARSKIDALSARINKSKTNMTPFNFTKPPAKPKEAPVVTEAPKAKTWAPLNFNKPAKPKEAAKEAPQEEVAPEAKVSKNKSWWPTLNFGKPAKAKEAAEAEKIPAKPWTPLNFNKPANPKEVSQAEAAPETKASKNRSWWPTLSFGKPSKAKEAAEAEKTPAKPWTPLNFNKPEKNKETVESGNVSNKKQWWTPLNFTNTAKQPSKQIAAEAKAENPPAAVTNPAETQPKESEAPAPETVEQPSEIKVTTDEAEVKTTASCSAEKEAPPSPSIEPTEDQIEKTEY